MKAILERQNPWVISSSLHFLLLATVSLLLWKPGPIASRYDFEVLEAPKVATQTPLTIEKPKVTQAEKRKAIFGVTKKSLTVEEGEVESKAGNTLAKTPDIEKLNPEDEEALPIPADEYLVTAMPRLVSEVRVPYPPEAKAKGIQGPVVMNLLIDSSGSVRKAELLQGPGFGLDEAALSAIKNFRFEAARVGEKSVAVKIRYIYRFVLEK